MTAASMGARRGAVHGSVNVFTAPDGSRVTLSGTALDGSGSWSCLLVARVYGTRHAFTVCSAGEADRYAASMGGVTLEAQAFRDAELSLGYSVKYAESIAAWRGGWHELLTTRSGPPANPGGITRVFDAFHLRDSFDGLMIRPRSIRHVTFEPMRVFKEIPGLGDLRIQRPPDSDVDVPAWRGAPGRAGEVWRKPFTGGGATGRARPETLVLATSTAVTELIPGPDDSADSAAAAAFLLDLDVSWTA